MALVAAWALVLAVCDIRSRLLPNWLTLGGAVVALGVRGVMAGGSG
ncbi:MAG: prepilin peptidase, partial [Verrucomicrobiota bacterium]